MDGFGGRNESDQALNPSPLTPIINLFEHAKTFGSLIQVPLEQADFLQDLKNQLQILSVQGDSFQKPAAITLLPFVRQASLLAQRYDAVIANPPYMGGKGMNPALKEFAKTHFPDSKSDLFAMFMERAFDLLKDNGYNAQVNMQSWMFLSSYQAMRENLLDKHTFITMAHLGARAFGQISGEVVQTTAFILAKKPISSYRPTFFRLIEGNEEQKQSALLSGQNRFDATVQDDFKKIPGSPVAYWVLDKTRKVFSDNQQIDSFVEKITKGIFTGNNERFIRLWSEVSYPFNGWKIYSKGGRKRRWWGNVEHVVDWSNDGKELLDFKGAGLGAMQYYNKPHFAWSGLTSGDISFRYESADIWFDDVSPSVISKEPNYSILGFLNSKVTQHCLNLLNPTLHYQIGDIKRLPITPEFLPDVDLLVKNAIQISLDDWGCNETSWNFQSNPLIVGWVSDSVTQQTRASDVGLRGKTANPTYKLATIYADWQTQNRQTIAEMQRLEQENNRLFIDAYGLQDELDADVPLEQITLTVNPYYRYKAGIREEGLGEGISLIPAPFPLNPKLEQRFQSDTLAELISYAIGCMMGRYRLDKPGLIYAHAGNIDFDKIYEQGIRDEGLGMSENAPPSPLKPNPYIKGEINERRDSSEELSGLDCVAEINGSGRAYLSDDQSISERGALRTKQSNSEGSSIDSIEHSGGACAAESIGISKLSIHSTGFESRSRDANLNSSSSRICDTRTGERNIGIAGGVIENAQFASEQTHPSALAPNPFIADGDGIIPLTDQDWFKDDATNRFRDFIKAAFPNPSPLNPNPLEDPLEQNLAFIAESLCLGSLTAKRGEQSLETIRRYLSNQFYKDHLKTYKKRPIYWLFSSGKQKAFECLVYLHRYNDSTLPRMRTEYVTPLLGKYDAFADQLKKQLEDATTSEATQLKKELLALEKKQTELRAFDDNLKHYADRRIKLDLDDGVKVNYGKFGDLLAEVKAVTGGKGD